VCLAAEVDLPPVLVVDRLFPCDFEVEPPTAAVDLDALPTAR
jgi:hypothetical protein